MEQWLEKFRKYVPSQIIAAFIAIEGLTPPRTPFDIYVVATSTSVLVILFIAYSIRAKSFSSNILMMITALSLPVWFFVISSDRFEEMFDTTLPKAAASALLVLTSVSLSLLDRDTPTSTKDPEVKP